MEMSAPYYIMPIWWLNITLHDIIPCVYFDPSLVGLYSGDISFNVRIMIRAYS